MSSHFSGANLKTAAKLKILDWYLEKYVHIMENNWNEYWYVDTHAGTGMTECDNGTLINGSAIRVLEEYADNFDRFYFYELDEEHFHTLVHTLSEVFDYTFDVFDLEDEEDNSEFTVASHDDPYIRIMQKDSNDGVSWLADKANSHPHWFTFIDPKGLTAKKSTLETLIQRGSMDILINYQTTGVMRNAAEEAAHAHDAVSRMLGDDEWPADASGDDYVSLYKERLEQNREWSILTKNLEDPNDRTYRFDLIFASANRTAQKIMRYIMDERDDLWEEASEELGQSGLGRWS